MTREIRIGRWSGITLAVVFAALSVAGSAVSACRLTTIAELPVRMVGDRIEVEGRIDDQPARLMVDTGAGDSVLLPLAAQRLGLATTVVKDREELTFLGRTRAQLTEIESLKLGQLVSGSRKMLVSDDYLPAGADIAGVVGEDVLTQADVELDLPHGVMRLFRDQGCGDAQMPYWAAAHYSQAPLQLDENPFGATFATVGLNGRPVTAAIDTGSPTSVVRLSVAGLAGARPDQGDQNGLWAGWTGMFDTVSVGDETIRGARIGLADDARYEQLTALASRDGPLSHRGSAMVLGLDFFRAHRVLISPSHHMMYFTYDGGPVFQADSSGAATPR